MKNSEDRTHQTQRVSMATVARLAGVSGQTVSRVVNASPRVDPATRARVEAAMTELGYRPHRAARALRTGRSDTLGVVVTTLESVGNFRMLQALSQEARQRGYALFVATVDTSLADAFEQLLDHGVDGAIIINEASAQLVDAVVPAGLALVAIDAPAGVAVTSVHSDHAGGAERATHHLLDAGHTSVSHLAGPAASFAAAERERGWRAALAARGIAAPEVVRGDWTADAGYAAGKALATASAVFVANDQMALGLVRALTDQGRAVPDEVAIVGFDDVPDAAHFRPPLTTVRQSFGDLGRAAVDRVIALIDGRSPGLVESLVPTELIVRDSATPRGGIATS